MRNMLNRASLRLVILVICFVWTLPTAGLLISSFRSGNNINKSGWWTVFGSLFNFTQWTLENYYQVLTTEGMGAAFLNSLVVTVPSVIIPLTMATFAAYAFAWMDFKGRDFLFVVIVGLLVVPLQMTLVPMLRLYVKLDLSGSFLGIWLAHAGFGIPLSVYLLYGYISQLPGDLFESAAIDGATHFEVFTRLVIPLSVPAIASLAIFQFIWVWNDLLVALVFLGTGDDVIIVTSQLSELVGSLGQKWHLLTAGGFVSMAIPLIVFFSLQRYFVRGLLAGSVKG